MARYTVTLTAAEADFIASSLAGNSWYVDLDRDAFGSSGEVVVTMDEAAKEHLEGLGSDDDGHIDSDGLLWIGGDPYQVTVLHNA